MATKYVRADGTATWADANGDDTAAANCCTIATAAANVSAGDLVYISGAGGDYTSGTLTITTAGSSGNEITWEGLNSPVFEGADLVSSGWTVSVSNANIYYASVATEPEQVFFDTSYGDRKMTAILSNNLDWVWDGGGTMYDNVANRLYVYCDLGDPDTVYTSPGIEISQRDTAIYIVGADYNTVDGITARRYNGSAFRALTSDNIEWKNCTAEWNWSHGFNGIGALFSDHLVEDCITRYNAGQGISFNNASGFDSIIVRRCKMYENGRYSSGMPGSPTWSGAIKFFADSGNPATNCVIEYCEAYSNGPVSPHNGSARGNGLWFDYASGTSGNENHIRYNLVYDNNANAVFLEASSYCHVYYNVCYDNAKGNDGSPAYDTAASIRLDSRDNEACSNNLIYNNTCYGGRCGLIALTYNQGGSCDMSDNAFRNNIIVGSVTETLWCDDGGDNDGTYGTGNVYNSNCLGAESSNFILWGTTHYSTYDTWISASSQTDNNIEADPSFTNVGSDDYTLASDSPCIDAGVDLGASFVTALMPASSWTDSVVTGSQDDY